MAAEQFVDVTYRGIELGKTLRLTDLGPTTAFLEFPTPMPVGAQLQIKSDSDFEITAVVVRVTEQVAGAEAPPGMRVRVDDLTGEVEAWWASKVSVDDPVIPTPPGGAQPEPEPEVEAAPEPVTDPEAEAVASAVPQAVEETVTEPQSEPPEEEADPEAQAPRKRRGPDGARSTMMMSTDEIRAAIEAGGQEFGNGAGEASDDDDGDDADGLGEVDAAIDDKAKGKKKKRRRKKRKTKG